MRPWQMGVLAGVLALGAIGVALGSAGAGVPFPVAASLPAAAVGLVMAVVVARGGHSGQPKAQTDAEVTAAAELEAHRAHVASLRHDLRGVLSPALMMSDRLLQHSDPAVQRAGGAVVRSIERATVLLSENKEAMRAPGSAGQPVAPG